MRREALPVIEPELECHARSGQDPQSSHQRGSENCEGISCDDYLHGMSVGSEGS